MPGVGRILRRVLGRGNLTSVVLNQWRNLVILWQTFLTFADVNVINLIKVTDMRNKFIAAGMLALATTIPANSQVKFEDYFEEKTMRFDFYHAGDFDTENFGINNPRRVE